MMKLGTQTGSLINHIYSRHTNPEPEVGMGATICMWSDRHAVTIIAIEKGILTTQGDKCTRTDSNGMSESQSYTYERDPHGIITHWKKDQSGKWRTVYRNEETGRWKMANHGNHLSIGYREEYYDFSF